MTSTNAGAVARRAMAAVARGARDEWIGLFADDAAVEDPVDGTPARRGRAAVADFWDTGIAMFETVRFDIDREHEAPGEALVIAGVTVTVPGGASARYDAAVHYRVDPTGRIESLRAFWDLPSVLAQLAGE